MLYEVPEDDEKQAAEEAPALIWAREEPGARRAAYSRDAIAEAALRVADKEGFSALSMRRVAQELGAGTMTLYHYVRNKDELITLMSDRMMGELLIPDDELPDDWRDAITEIAVRSRNAFVNHPWAIENMKGGDGGPNGMKHFEQSLLAVDGTGASPMKKLEIVSLVDDYVFGFVMRELVVGNWTDREEGDRDNSWSEATLDYFEGRIATGEYPQIAALRGDGSRDEGMKRIEEAVRSGDRFTRGLSFLLDGIEASLAES